MTTSSDRHDGGDADRPDPARSLADQARDAAALAWIRTQRGREPYAGSPIGGAIRQVRREVATTRQRFGRLIGPWESQVPPELASRCRLEGIRGDALFVAVDSPSTAWQLDRRLRAGLSKVLIEACGSGVRRVRVRVGDPTSFHADGARTSPYAETPHPGPRPGSHPGPGQGSDRGGRRGPIRPRH